MKSEAFVSVVIVIESPDYVLTDDVTAIQRDLAGRYSDYEILLIVQGPARRLILDARVSEILATVPCVRLIQLAFAVHREVARAAGIENAIGDFVIIFDPVVDPLEVIGAAVATCQRGNDVVIGISSLPRPPLYRLTRHLTGGLLAAIDYQIPRNATDFRCVSRRAINAVIDTGRFYHQLNLRLQKTGYPSEVVIYEPRVDLLRLQSLFGAASRFLRIFIYNSSRPLRWMSGVGLLGSCLAFFFAIYGVTVRLLKEGVVEGWTTTILFMSVQFMLLFVILAFISEYMSRLLDEQRGSNDYAVVYEKNSAMKINDTRVNVLSESASPEVNLVQTGRRG